MKKNWFIAGHQWLTLIILATQKAEIRRITVKSQPRQVVHETLSRKKNFTKKGLVEWLKVKVLSSNPSTAKKKKVHVYSNIICNDKKEEINKYPPTDE
jgi:hypothetical protein